MRIVSARKRLGRRGLTNSVELLLACGHYRYAVGVARECAGWVGKEVECRVCQKKACNRAAVMAQC